VKAIGLCGTHRVGKTTLCDALSSDYGVPFVGTHASAAFQRLGLRACDDLTPNQRLEVQMEILSDAEASWKKGRAEITKKSKATARGFVTDRTPLDFMTYCMTDPAFRLCDQDLVKEYMGRCVRVANEQFHTIFILQPGIAYADDATKEVGKSNQLFRDAWNATAIGLAIVGYGSKLTCNIQLVPSSLLDLGDRARLVYDTLAVAWE
jgi:hypothetical protein